KVFLEDHLVESQLLLKGCGNRRRIVRRVPQRPNLVLCVAYHQRDALSVGRTGVQDDEHAAKSHYESRDMPHGMAFQRGSAAYHFAARRYPTYAPSLEYRRCVHSGQSSHATTSRRWQGTPQPYKATIATTGRWSDPRNG